MKLRVTVTVERIHDDQEDVVEFVRDAFVDVPVEAAIFTSKLSGVVGEMFNKLAPDYDWFWST